MSLTLSLTLIASPALAFEDHTFTTTFAGSGTNTLANPSDVAVDNAVGSSANDLYVTDPQNHRVEKFTASGEFLLMFGKDVDETTGGNVCPEHLGDACKAGTEGASPGAFITPTFVAVDSSSGGEGDIYVGDTGDDSVSKFDSSGNLIASWGIGGQLAFGGLDGIAVDPSGNLFVEDGQISWYAPDGALISAFGYPREPNPAGLAVDSENSLYKVDGTPVVTKFSDTGAELANPLDGGGSTSGLTIDPSSNDLYVDESGSFINHFTLNCGEECTPTDSFGSGHLTGALGIGVDSSTGTVYVANAGEGNVTVFDSVIIPDVSTGPITNEVQTSGTFTGHVSTAGAGSITSCNFQYVTEEAFNATGFSELAPGGELACEPSAPIAAATEVKANFSSLTSDTPYVYRLVAGNANGTNLTAGRVSFTPHAVESLKTEAASNVTSSSVQFNGSFVGNGQDTHYYFEWGTNTSYGTKTPAFPTDAGSPSGPEPTLVTPVTLPTRTLAAETEYHYRIVASNAAGTSFGEDRSFTTPANVVELKTLAATNFSPTSAQLNGSFIGNGEPTHYYFEWGLSGYEHTTPAPPGGLVPGGGGLTSISVNLTGLSSLTPYNFRILASNGEGATVGENEVFELPLLPRVTESVTGVQSDVAILDAQINPGGGEATYHYEYATESEYMEHGSYGNSAPVPDAEAGSGLTFISVSSLQVAGLKPGTTYDWRVVATNSSGTVDGPDRTFSTYPFIPVVDSCPNAHVRQQTGAAELPDCRAYELVSAGNSGGYDVESDLVEGQTPYGGYPQAESPPRVLYAVHDGGIPGTGDPTNRGPDPYIATRGANGWSTEYVGIRANIDPASDPFSSTLAEATPNLETFAFSGEKLCAPCFGEGIETGIPLHLPNGSLVQGMAGSINPGANASPDGHIAKYFSADGSHFIFGSVSQFEPDANNNGDVSIYDRNLTSGQTHVVSKNPTGENLPCLQGAGSCHSPADPNGIAELDVSKDGSRIIVAQKVSEDADHNVYYHPYVNIGDSSKTIDLAPGSTSGVLYDGMTEGGSRVFFTTKDKLLAADTDESADLYEAEVSPEGKLNLQLLSTGSEGTGNSDACDPVSNEAGAHWNSLEATPNCGVVAIGGGGGVASEDGTIYFLSPELLDGGSNGTQNQPNLYVVRPGSAPQFVATLAPNDPTVIDGLKEAGVRHTADFQVTPNGEFAAFTSTQPLTGFENAGYSEVYRYAAASEKLDCASCDPTGVEPTNGSELASNGLSLTNDGRVFFTTAEPLVERDGDGLRDVYEWEERGTGPKAAPCQTPGGCVDLISTGTSAFDSSLLGVSANGIDAYFFTRDKLAPQDENGDFVKVYDARELGGFPYTPPPVPCKASDECHGPSSPIPAPPNISVNTGTSGKEVQSKCATHFVDKHGKCIRRSRKPHRRHGRRTARHHRGARS